MLLSLAINVVSRCLQPYRCAAYHAVSATLDLNRLRTWLRTNGLVASYFDDVLHVQYDCAPTLDDSAFMQQIKKLGGSGSDAAAATDLAHDLFVFDNGAMVSWGTRPEEEELWVSQLRDFRTVRASERMSERASELALTHGRRS